MASVLCVPNVSEGRRSDVIAALADTLAAVRGVQLLDYSADASHHRSVFTFAGAPAAVADAVLALYERAVPAIDLRSHQGEHPRIGAVDVVPFVPLAGTAMNDCVTLARSVGARIAERFTIPVFLYEEAATAPDRRRLENVRRGGPAGLAARMADGSWRPDFGPSQLHPTAGASAVGARRPLIAFNVNLATDDLSIAKRIAAIVRERSGGLPGVKALGVRLEQPAEGAAEAGPRRLVQVTMNVTDYERAPLSTVFAAIAREAQRDGVEIAGSEIIGLVPAAALRGVDLHALRLESAADQILEHRLRDTTPR